MWNQNYGCGCNNQPVNNCGCNNQPVNNCGCVTVQNGPQIGMTLVVTNSWNSPAVGASTELDVPGALSILVGTYIQNPNYGKFLITSFNSDTAKITVQNTGFGNLTPGYIIPANTYFNIATASFNKKGVWTPVFYPAGGMSFTIQLVQVNQYWAQEDLVFFSLQVSGALTGTPSGNILVSPPIPADGYTPGFVGEYNQGGPSVLKGSLTNPLAYGLPVGPPLIGIQKSDNSNFGISNILISLNGFYKAAPYNL